MKFLFFQHTATEPLGYLEEAIKKHGIQIEPIRLFEGAKVPSLKDFDALIVMGGPFHVDEEEKFPFLVEEKESIRAAVANEMPYLGICLGGQLLASCLGAKVPKNPGPEIGYYDVTLTEEGRQDPLFKGLPKTLRMMQWHFDTFDQPVGTHLLATTPTCKNQAIRHGRNAYGIQFHFEVEEKLATRWVTNSPDELAAHGFDGAAIIAEARQRQGELKKITHTIFNNFLGLF